MAVLSLRDIRKRIRGTHKTKQITRTMQMVAASRLKKAEEKLRQAKPYFQKMEMILSRLLSHREGLHHPFLEPREVKSVGLVVVTSDRGLCGAYNANVISAAEAYLNRTDIPPVKLILIGKKGFDYFKSRQWPILDHFLDVAGRPDFRRITQISDTVVGAYLAGEIDEAHLIYTQFISVLSIKPVCERFLSLQQEDKIGAAFPAQTIFEPNLEEIVDQFLPQYVASRMYISLVGSATAENSARMIAMKTATDNAGEMIDRLTLMRNKARQAAITKEILEIVTAGEALKG